jgi:hypothetical protein
MSGQAIANQRAGRSPSNQRAAFVLVGWRNAVQQGGHRHASHM